MPRDSGLAAPGRNVIKTRITDETLARLKNVAAVNGIGHTEQARRYVALGIEADEIAQSYRKTLDEHA